MMSTDKVTGLVSFPPHSAVVSSVLVEPRCILAYEKEDMQSTSLYFVSEELSSLKKSTMARMPFWPRPFAG